MKKKSRIALEDVLGLEFAVIEAPNGPEIVLRKAPPSDVECFFWPKEDSPHTIVVNPEGKAALLHTRENSRRRCCICGKPQCLRNRTDSELYFVRHQGKYFLFAIYRCLTNETYFIKQEIATGGLFPKSNDSYRGPRCDDCQSSSIEIKSAFLLIGRTQPLFAMVVREKILLPQELLLIGYKCTQCDFGGIFMLEVENDKVVRAYFHEENECTDKSIEDKAKEQEEHYHLKRIDKKRLPSFGL